MNCPKFPILMSDYESQIGTAACEVWPELKLRGCYYHYLNNCLNKQ